MKRLLMCFIITGCFFAYYLNSTASIKNTVVIIGSEPECIAAAVTASKLGYHVTIITEDSSLGGLFTEGMLTALDINYDNDNQVLHKGFFEEFLTSCSNGYNLDLEQTKAFFKQSIATYNINVIYDIEKIRPIVQTDQVVGIEYFQGTELKKIYADFIVDGSSEAVFTRKLEVPYKKGRSEFGRPDSCAAATLIFSVHNADWNHIISYLESDDNPHSGYKRNAAWGFSNMYQCPTTHEKLQMRGLNLSRQNDGSIIINALLIFDVDATKKDTLKIAHSLAKNELPFIMSYLSKNCPGFENAVLGEVANKLYIREGIRIVGEDTLDGCAVFEHTNFSNTIAYGSYPIDLQATRKGEYGNALCGKCLYSIPLGCMLPKGIKNLLVIGRSSSFDIIAHGSARTVPVLMSMAENAVVAMDYSLKNQISIQQLNENPKKLSSFYEYLNHFNGFSKITLPKDIDSSKWYYPYIRDLRSKGYFGTGYASHDIETTENTKKTVNVTLSLFTSHSAYVLPESCKKYIHQLSKNITAEELCKIVSYMIEGHFNTLEDLYNKNIIDQITYTYTNHGKRLSHADIYALLDCAFKYIYSTQPTIIFRDPPDILSE
jgi:hypothetical protein